MPVTLVRAIWESSLRKRKRGKMKEKKMRMIKRGQQELLSLNRQAFIDAGLSNAIIILQNLSI